MKLSVATKQDFEDVAKWLAEEEIAYDRWLADGDDVYRPRGFHCNLSVIERCFAKGELEVVNVDGKAIAFHLGQFLSPGITEVHPDFRGQGVGTLITEEILQRAKDKEICRLHVSCINAPSVRFWSKFGFVPKDEYSQDYYHLLSYSLALPGKANQSVTVEFFSEMGWYSSSPEPYKAMVIPCLQQGGTLFLAEMCHNAIIRDEDTRGDNHIRVTLDAKVIFEGWLGDNEAKAFGFSRNPYCYNTFSKAFCLT